MENLKAKRNIKPFDGERYSVWKLRIRALINELDATKVIDDEIPELLSVEWRKAKRIAKSVIVDTGSTARESLKRLDTIYERKSLATQLALSRGTFVQDAFKRF